MVGEDAPCGGDNTIPSDGFGDADRRRTGADGSFPGLAAGIEEGEDHALGDLEGVGGGMVGQDATRHGRFPGVEGVHIGLEGGRIGDIRPEQGAHRVDGLAMGEAFRRGEGEGGVAGHQVLGRDAGVGEGAVCGMIAQLPEEGDAGRDQHEERDARDRPFPPEQIRHQHPGQVEGDGFQERGEAEEGCAARDRVGVHPHHHPHDERREQGLGEDFLGKQQPGEVEGQ